MTDLAWPFVPQDALDMSFSQATSILQTPLTEQRSLLVTTPRIAMRATYLLPYASAELARNLIAATTESDDYQLYVPAHPWAVRVGDRLAGAVSHNIGFESAWYDTDTPVLVYNGTIGELVTATGPVSGGTLFTTALTQSIPNAFVAPAFAAFARNPSTSEKLYGVRSLSVTFIGDAVTDLREGLQVVSGGFPTFPYRSLASPARTSIDAATRVFDDLGPAWATVVRRNAERGRVLVWSFLRNLEDTTFRSAFGRLMQLRGACVPFTNAEGIAAASVVGIAGSIVTIQNVGMYLDPPAFFSLVELDGTVRVFKVSSVVDGGSTENVTLETAPGLTAGEVTGASRVDLMRLSDGTVDLTLSQRDYKLTLRTTRCLS